MNTKKEDGNDIDIDLVKDNYSTQPSEKLKIPKPPQKTSPEESEPQYNFQGKSARSQNWFDLDTDCIEDIF